MGLVNGVYTARLCTFVMTPVVSLVRNLHKLVLPLPAIHANLQVSEGISEEGTF